MQQCNFSGTKQVRFGANCIYNYGTFTGGVLCANSIFGDPINGVVKHCDYARLVEHTPELKLPYVHICRIRRETNSANETEQCNFSGTKQVRYGANDAYNYGI